MKENRIIDFQDFLDLTTNLETPFKFFEIDEDGKEIYAYVHLRTFLISWEGENSKDREKSLKENDFKNSKILETKRLDLSDMTD